MTFAELTSAITLNWNLREAIARFQLREERPTLITLLSAVVDSESADD
jgi:hypothetical protein